MAYRTAEIVQDNYNSQLLGKISESVLTIMVTASLTIPATVTVMALVTEIRIYSVSTWNGIGKKIQKEPKPDSLLWRTRDNYKKHGQINDISYHKEGQCTAKKHEQTTSCDMPGAVKIFILWELMPRVQQKGH